MDSHLQKANASSIGAGRRGRRRAAGVLLLAGIGPLAALSVHPQDGPHVDLQLVIAEDSVRLQTVVNLAFADELVEPARENLETLHPVEREPLGAALFERLSELSEVVVDGRVLTPARGRFEVFDPDPALLGLFPIYGARALTQVRVDLEYALDAPPETVSIAWRAFPDDTAARRISSDVRREVLARLSAGGVESVITFFEGEGPFVWSATGTSVEDHLLAVPGYESRPLVELPLVSLGLLLIAVVSALGFAMRPRSGTSRRRVFVVAWLLIGSWLAGDLARVPLGSGDPVPTEEQALEVFAPLHANVYRSFDFTEEGDVYDALALSAEGPLLERLYEEIYLSLAQEEAGGAVGRVQGLTPLETRVTGRELVDGRPQFGVEARWQVEGAVFHWGHAHWRVQELAARYVVRASRQEDGGRWRLAESEITEQVLISATQDRPGEDGPNEIPEEL